MKYTKFKEIPQFTKDGGYVVDYPLDMLEDWLSRMDARSGTPLELDPDFQRGHVWNEAQQIAYVEFLLRGGKSSRDIYFNCSSWGMNYNTPIVLVDGKQRLEACRRFMNNQIPAFGTLYKDYEDSIGMTIGLKFHVNDLKTRKEVLQWYIDLNAGGVVHTTEEITKVRKLLEQEG